MTTKCINAVNGVKSENGYTLELKDALIRIYNNHEWDKHVEINGEQYIYISCKNEFRRVVHQTGEDIAVLVGCMAFGRFMWCC